MAQPGVNGQGTEMVEAGTGMVVPTNLVELLTGASRWYQMLVGGRWDGLMPTDYAVSLGVDRSTPQKVWDEGFVALGFEIMEPRPDLTDVQIIFNHERSPARFHLKDEKRLVLPFARIYLKHPAKSGILKFRVYKDPLLVPVLSGQVLGDARGVLDSSNARIDPATEPTLQSVLAQLDVALSTRASEASLVSELPRSITGVDLSDSPVASTTNPLAAGASWTSPAFVGDRYARICFIISTDQAGSVHIEGSPDGTTWIRYDSYAFGAGGDGSEFNVLAPQLRLIVENTSGSGQTSLAFYAWGRVI